MLFKKNNMDEELEEALKALELSDKEIRAYLALLAGGALGATSLAKRARLNRITAYHIVKSLSEKGLASHVVKSGVSYFKAADPKVVLRILEEKRERFARVLPQLERMKESVLEHPDVEVYEGKEGIKSIMDDFVNERKEILAVGSEQLDELMGFYFPQYIRRRVAGGVRIRIMFGKSKYSESMRKRDRKELRETRFIACGKLATGIYAYGDKVAFLSFQKAEPMGLIIEDRAIAGTVRTLLELFWGNSA